MQPTLLLSISILVLTSCRPTQSHGDTTLHAPKDSSQANALIYETSPYLLQHAYNPVQWHAWNRATLEKAQKENKMLLISIGYAACHWCHVMEHESFEDSTVAALMNEHFICIKVDREERPDVDQVYMTACQLINRSGGWPLNALALPNGQPFYAGTYFPKKDWLKVLQHFINLYQKQPKELAEAAQQLTAGITKSQQWLDSADSSASTMARWESSVQQWCNNLDEVHGGFKKKNNKFPLPSQWNFLLHYAHRQQDQALTNKVLFTLDKIAAGGIYDQIGGGFARYSTDQQWQVPHFEKMLYDNAQLVQLYAQAYQLTQKPRYQQVVYETLDWVERALTAPTGGCYASLDADSEGEEGAYYTWTNEQLTAILGKETATIIQDIYTCTPQGNWEGGRNVLWRTSDLKVIAKRHQLSLDELDELVEKAKACLLKARQKRIVPPLDDKILTSWNALMISAYAKAYQAFQEPKFLAAAKQHANFLEQKLLQKNGRLYRHYTKGKAAIDGFLDDYAFLIRALIDLYQVTFDEDYLKLANQLMQHVQQHFSAEQQALFPYRADYHPDLVVDNTAFTDDVIPSANSVLAHNLLDLGILLNQQKYQERAMACWAAVQANAFEQPAYFSNWAALSLKLLQRPYELAILGAKHQEIRATLARNYLPNVLWLGGTKEGSLSLLEDKLVKGSTMIYVCQNRVCQRPTKEISTALSLLKNQ